MTEPALMHCFPSKVTEFCPLSEWGIVDKDVCQIEKSDAQLRACIPRPDVIFGTLPDALLQRATATWQESPATITPTEAAWNALLWSQHYLHEECENGRSPWAASWALALKSSFFWPGEDHSFHFESQSLYIIFFATFSLILSFFPSFLNCPLTPQ